MPFFFFIHKSAATVLSSVLRKVQIVGKSSLSLSVYSSLLFYHSMSVYRKFVVKMVRQALAIDSPWFRLVNQQNRNRRRRGADKYFKCS